MPKIKVAYIIISITLMPPVAQAQIPQVEIQQPTFFSNSPYSSIPSIPTPQAPSWYQPSSPVMAPPLSQPYPYIYPQYTPSFNHFDR